MNQCNRFVMNKSWLFLPLFFGIAIFFSGCRHRIQAGGGYGPDPDLPDPVIVWGLGDVESAAIKQQLFTDAGMEILSHWFNGPEEWQWGYESSENQKKIRGYYDSGLAIQIVVWLHDWEEDHPGYLTGRFLREDAARLARIWSGNGYRSDRLFFVLFSEVETYYNLPSLTREKVLEAYKAARKAIKEVAPDARVGLGFGGYSWLGPGEPDLSPYEEILRFHSDIACVQHMHDYRNYELMCEQVPESITQLGRYNLPVMVSHFKFWQDNHPENPGAQVTAGFVQEYLTGERLRKLYTGGLRYWVFMAEVAEEQIRPGTPEYRQLVWSLRTHYPYPYSIAPDETAADQLLAEAWENYKQYQITTEGAGGFFRVGKPNGETVSEGIGYGMLLAVCFDDLEIFDGLWQYAKAHHNEKGLMDWKIGPDNRPTADGKNSATDADEDMAFALIAADMKWGGYREDAEGLVASIWQHQIEHGTYIVKGGDHWGGAAVTNPSYFAPGYYKIFQKYTGNQEWGQVVDAGYEMIARLNEKTGAGQTGLLPDWTKAGGEPAPGFSFNYTYDACRVPLRLAMDAVWFGDRRALAQLAKMNSFFARTGARGIKAGYTLDGKVINDWSDVCFTGPAGVAALFSTDQEYRREIWGQTVAMYDPKAYYQSSLRLLSLLLMSGGLANPLE
jgi:endo-1,4-beta-D-glucanase Y